MHPEIPIGTYDNKIAIGDAKFISLIEKNKQGIIYNFLNMIKNKNNIMEQFSNFLIQETDRSIFDYYEEYAISNFFFFFMKNKLKGKDVRNYPYNKQIALKTLSSDYFYFKSENKSTALKFDFESKDIYSSWVFTLSPAKEISLYKINNTERTLKDNIFPFSTDGEIYLLLINNAYESINVGLNVQAVIEYPCNLAIFQIKQEEGSIIINWITSKEIDTKGWFIYKKDEDEKAYYKLTRYMIPAAGNSNDMIRYIYIDKDVKLGKKYSYYIEVITRKDFNVSYSPISIKLK